jgi:hypothetical protein
MGPGTMSKSTFKFVAMEGGSETDEEFVIAGMACDGHFLNFQRSLPIGSEDDWGVHIEFDDQINSGYEKVKSCNLSRERLRVEFTEPIDRQKRYLVAEIELQISDPEYDSFTDELRTVFAQHEHLLTIQN